MDDASPSSPSYIYEDFDPKCRIHNKATHDALTFYLPPGFSLDHIALLSIGIPTQSWIQIFGHRPCEDEGCPQKWIRFFKEFNLSSNCDLRGVRMRMKLDDDNDNHNLYITQHKPPSMFNIPAVREEQMSISLHEDIYKDVDDVVWELKMGSPEFDTLLLYLPSPGFTKNQVSVRLTESQRLLEISGHTYDLTAYSGGQLRVPPGFKLVTRFSKNISVSCNYDSDRIEKKIQYGILYITLPKVITKRENPISTSQLIKKLQNMMNGALTIWLNCCTWSK
ncbi:unnamed protein product [Cuscuta epithymum]|uniref:SHSP domain-containing protein n=1 Tax=Cuscuta epithymum TaxID=186058 RepID=A0AAV0CUQ8_9ASTE|nr:unnamed protein product [Cuscuta epithymum]